MSNRALILMTGYASICHSGYGNYIKTFSQRCNYALDLVWTIYALSSKVANQHYTETEDNRLFLNRVVVLNTHLLRGSLTHCYIVILGTWKIALNVSWAALTLGAFWKLFSAKAAGASFVYNHLNLLFGIVIKNLFVRDTYWLSHTTQSEVARMSRAWCSASLNS